MALLIGVRVVFLIACSILIYCGETYKINLLKNGKRKHGEKDSMIITLAEKYDLHHHDQLHKKKKKHGLKEHRHKNQDPLLSRDYRTKS